MTKDRAVGILSFILGVAVAIGAYQLPPSSMANDIGPAFFPYITAAILIGCGAGLIVTKRPKEEKPFFTKEQLIRLARIAGVIIAYVVLEDLIGFLIPTLVALFVLCMMFSKKGQTAWWKALLYSAIVTLVVYFLFTKGFSMVLPTGTLF